MNIVALDLSLTGTGISNNGVTSTVKTKLTDEARLSFIYDAIWDHCWPKTPDLIVMEGLAYSSVMGKATERAGLWWIVKMGFWHRDVPVAVITPNARAKFATGKGNSGKDEVMLAAALTYPEANIKNNNEADAQILYAMAKDHYGEPLVPLPALNKKALDAVQWPDLSI